VEQNISLFPVLKIGESGVPSGDKGIRGKGKGERGRGRTIFHACPRCVIYHMTVQLENRE